MMTRWERWSLNLLITGVSLTGVIFFWMKYVLESNDPFSVINHPLQSGMLEVHLLLSPLLIFLVGMVTRSHITGKLKNGSRRGRLSGLLSLFSFPIMVISGYWMQVSSDPLFLKWLTIVHIFSGTLFFVLFLIHQVVSWRLARGRRLAKTRRQGVRLAA